MYFPCDLFSIDSFHAANISVTFFPITNKFETQVDTLYNSSAFKHFPQKKEKSS
jgi:hypothetical protein